MHLLNEIFAVQTAYAQVTEKSIGTTGTKVISETTDELGKLISNFFAQIPLWIAAILVAILSYGLATVVKRSIESKFAQKGIAEEHKEMQIVASRSASVIVLVIGITIALSIVGIDLKPIVAAGAFGLGFALKDVIMNLISGMFILASRHYTIGDIISVNGTTGRIKEIQTRATIIRAFDGTKVILPNSTLLKNKVISKTSNPTRRLEFIMGCGYDDDLRKVVEITLKTLKTIPDIIPKPPPKVVFYEWGDFEVLFKIKVWIDSKGGKMLQVKNDVIIKLTEAYNEADFEMPYPIQTVELTSMYSPPVQVDMHESNEHRPYVSGYPTRFRKARHAAFMKRKEEREAKYDIMHETPMTYIENVNEKLNSINTEKSLPNITQTTANSPGQSWLQKTMVGEQKLPQQEAEIERINVQSFPEKMQAEKANIQSLQQEKEIEKSDIKSTQCETENKETMQMKIIDKQNLQEKQMETQKPQQITEQQIQPDLLTRPPQTEQISQPVQAEQLERPIEAEQLEQPPHTEQLSEPNSVSLPPASQQTEQSNQSQS